MKLNVGCGFNRLAGWLNIDKVPACEPDMVMDVEQFPWPWPDNSAEEVRLIHVLEHIGASPDVFLGFMKELWRVCKPNAAITILVPHPRSDEFLWDATHVRPITAEGLRMFSQQRNREMIAAGNPETPLGIYCGVDFRIVAVDYVWKRRWSHELQSGKLGEPQLYQMLSSNLNIAKEISVKLAAIKSTGQAFRDAAKKI